MNLDQVCGVKTMISMRRGGNEACSSGWGLGHLGAEADRGDLASSEPACRVDSVLGDEIAPHGIGLLLGQCLGQIRIAIGIGEGRDDDLRSRQTGLLAPPRTSSSLVRPRGVRIA